MSTKKSQKDVEIKRLLKETNKLLTGKKPDPQTALETCDEVLQMDKENYYACLFKGMALSQLGAQDGLVDGVLNDSYKESIKSLTKATELNADALFPWKALLDIRALDPNFVDFFATLERCAIIMVDLNSKKIENVDDDNNNSDDKEGDDDLPKIQLNKLNSDDLNYIRFQINDYINRFEYKKNNQLNIHYLHFITPHLSHLGTILGSKIQSAVQSVNSLIEIYSKIEQDEIKSATQKAKTNWPINVTAQAKFLREGDVKWSIYKDSKILKENLWELLVDLEAFEDEKSKNDYKRWKVMARQIDYLTQILYCAPDGTRVLTKPKKAALVIGKSAKAPPPDEKPADEKSKIRAKIQDIQGTLVLLKAQIQPIWDQYFEWSDPLNFAKLDVNDVIRYIKSFGKNTGLGKLFYMLSISEISPWDNTVQTQLQNKKKGKKSNFKKSKKSKKQDDEEDIDHIEDVIGPQQIFTEMTDAISGNDVSNSVIAHRIYLTFAIHLKEYQLALDQSHKYAALLSDLKLKSGLELKNSSLDYAFNLAIIYTYYESPKNFPKAEKLYSKVLKDDPNNIRASIGMARIKMETGLYSESKAMFENVLSQLVETNLKIDIGEVLMEYGWCCVNLSDYENGRKALNKAKTVIFGKEQESSSSEEDEQGSESEAEDVESESDEDFEEDSSAASLDVKATLLYREAQSYFMELNEVDDSLNASMRTSYLTKAFQLLIQCIKISSTYAPAYTSLGELYTSNAENCENENEITININKAFKCFYRAFELDPGELRSTYAVTEHFSEKKDWDMVDLICNSVIENERARKSIVNVSKSAIRSKYVGPWPYRILGIVHMEKQDDNKAIEYFQSALRIDQHDYASWTALGEAYLSRGKIEAGRRVFKHVICLQAMDGYNEIDSLVDVELTTDILVKADWHPIYLLAEACSLMGEFLESFELLQLLLERGDIAGMESFILTKICEVLVSRTGREIFSGAIMRSLATITEAFQFFEKSIRSSTSLKLWKIYGDSLLLCINTQSHIAKLPFDIINEIIDISYNEIVSANDFIIKDIWVELEYKNDLKLETSQSNRDQLDGIHYALVLSGFAAISNAPKQGSRLLLSSLVYNLAILFLSWYRDSKLDIHRDIAIKLLKKSIQFEPTNAGYWNTLGLTCMNRNSRVAQHCFIKALSIDTKAAPVWFNLGMLYVKNKDYELANQAFMRSQSLSPGTSSAWAGQAVVANATGKKDQAKTLFAHSFVTSNGKNVGTTLLYSSNVLECIIENLSEERDLDDVQQLTSATAAILKYLNHYPEDTFALEIACSIVERLHIYDKGIDLSERLCSLVKAQYESRGDNDHVISTAYCKVMIQHARIELGNGQFQNAMDTTDVVTSVLDQLFERNLFNEVIQRIQLSTFSVSGLSKYFLGDFDGSLQELNKIVEVFPDTRRVVVLISQVLYALGNAETKEAAVEELLMNIQEQGSSLLVVMTIAAISIIENWGEYMDAVKDEFDRLDFQSRIEDLHREVPMLLDIINQKLELQTSNIWQRSAFMFPGDTTIWSQINHQTALEVSKSNSNIGASALAKVSISVGGTREIQRGIWLSPGGVGGHLELLSSTS